MSILTTPKQTPEIVERGGDTGSPFRWIALAIVGLAVIATGILWLVLRDSGVSIENETAEIQQMLADLEAAQNRMDDGAMVANLSENVVAQIDTRPVLEGKDAVQQAFQALWPIFVSFDITDSTTVVSESGDVAWQHGTHVYELNLPEIGQTAVPGKWMTTLEKVDGDWKVTGLAISDIMPQA